MTNFDKTDLNSAAWPSQVSAQLQSEKYRVELAELELTEKQLIDLLQTLWSIMSTFVELGFDVKICEQIFPLADDSPDDGGNSLSSTFSKNGEAEEQRPEGR